MIAPDATDANSSAAAAPAPSPIRSDLHHRKLSRFLSG